MHYVPVLFSLIIISVGLSIFNDCARDSEDPFEMQRPQIYEQLKYIAMGIVFFGLIFLSRSIIVFSEAMLLQN